MRVADEDGARDIGKFLNGQSWDELVGEALEARRNNPNPRVLEV